MSLREYFMTHKFMYPMFAAVLVFMKDGIRHVYIGAVHEDENDLLSRVEAEVDIPGCCNS